MDSNEVLSFWFDEIQPKQWWVKDPEFDALIEQRFAELHQQASQCELYCWRDSAKGRLAEILVLDQFSRNMYRDTPAAFSCDPLALALAQEAVALGKDAELSQLQRSFLYMPYMHSESLEIHNVAMTLYKSNGIQANIDFEIKHRDIIVEFGRYPHRNAILNRPSTKAEMAFLEQPGSSF